MATSGDGPTGDAIKALMLLQQHGQLATAEIAAALGIDRRKARRTLKRLAEHVPLQNKGTGRDRVWVLDPMKGSVNLGIYDRIALQVGRDATSFLNGTPLAETLERASTDGSVPRTIAENYKRKIRVKAEPAWRPDDRRDPLHDILDGLLRERSLDLTYQARKGTRHYPEFRPLTLVAYRRVLYLFGYADPQSNDQVHRLRVDRLSRIVVGTPFTYPAEWDPDDELDRWFGIEASGQVETIVIEFSAKAADLVHERIWHPSQRIEPLDDGRIRLIMRTGGRELIRFALEWGELARVVTPDWLRDEVQSALRQALAQYEPVG